MKGLIKTIIVAGVSYAAGYVTCRQLQERYYLDVANRKLQEQDEHHAACVKELETQIGDLQMLLEERNLELFSDIVVSKTSEQVSTPDLSKTQLVQAEIAMTSYQGDPAQPIDYTQFSGKTAATNVVSTEISHAPRQGEPLLPRLIKEEEFLETENTYVFSLYMGDDTLVDERDEPISVSDRISILGHLDGTLLPHINHENNVFVYNPEGNYAVQICISMGSYSSEVGG